MSEFDLMNGAALGMEQQRALLDLSARNVAAAQASRPGHEYARLVADFNSAVAHTSIARGAGDGAGDADDADDIVTANGDPDDAESAPATVVAAALPHVHTERGSADALTEMIAVLDAQRSYEQNASIFDLGKHLAERTIEVGRS